MAEPEVQIGDLGEAPVIPLIMVMVAGYLLWFGVRYWRSDMKWPSDPVKSVLQGKGVPVSQPVTTSADILTAAETQSSGQGSGGNGGGSGNVPVPPNATGNPERNQNTAKLLCAAYGWAPQQNRTEWNALVDLWNRESGWNEYAKNPSSGAYGIPQSLPASKMASAGADWLTNASTQIRWGLRYIKGRYGSPAGAWAHEEANGWY